MKVFLHFLKLEKAVVSVKVEPNANSTACWNNYIRSLLYVGLRAENGHWHFLLFFQPF